MVELKRGNRETKLSRGWLDGFLNINEHLKVDALHSVESTRTDAITSDCCHEQIVRIKAAIKRYKIATPNLIINTDESGVSFKDIKGRKKRYGVGPRENKIIQTVERTAGKLDHVKMVSVVNGMGRNFKPLFSLE